MPQGKSAVRPITNGIHFFRPHSPLRRCHRVCDLFEYAGLNRPLQRCKRVPDLFDFPGVERPVVSQVEISRILAPRGG